VLSIITTIHNGLAVNKIFYHFIKKYTNQPFELIVIDNISTDGSTEFFEKQNAIVFRNEKNYSYPHCQNQGIQQAKCDWLVFINNDVIVPPDWDKHLLETAEKNNLTVLTSCGIERIETPEATAHFTRKWKRIKNPLSVFGYSENNLSLMHKWMYGDWEKFSDERWKQFGTNVMEGFIGNTVMMRRSEIEKIGLWDERIQGADFDLYMRTKERQKNFGDITPVHIALGVFIHHFIRITVKSKPVPFADTAKLISLEEKWGKEKIKNYLKDMNDPRDFFSE
jgi:GT2 family glycosyltransferase